MRLKYLSNSNVLVLTARKQRRSAVLHPLITKECASFTSQLRNAGFIAFLSNY